MRASHYAQGWTRAGAGEAPFCGLGLRPASVVAHNQNQSRAVTARHVSQTCVPLLALHLAGLRAPSFSHLPGATLHTTRQRRQGIAPLPRNRSAATFIRRCAWRAANTQFSRRLVQSCAHQFRIGHEPGSNVAYPLHFLERLSSRAGFDDQQLSERPITRAQEPFAFGATDE